MTNVEINVTIMNGTGGTYPLITPRKAIPNGMATAHPLTTFLAVEVIKLLSSVSSGEYVAVRGEVLNHAVTNGKAVSKTAKMSRSPLVL